ncbi:MAG: hypothetical protein HOO67_06880, partial [Candidatus Peribacteraceae bacterium]|nr:hypothetical protein [Candidatus Peribacteraceae bacterium]
MPDQKAADDARKKKTLEEFHEKSLAGMEGQKKSDERRRSAHQEEESGFQKRGEGAIAEETKATDKKKKQDKAWRAGQVKQKEEIVADKKKRAADARYVKEKKQKDRDYEEKQRKFFESFRAAAAAKALQDRKKYQRDQELKAEMIRFENDAYQEKIKADAHDLQTKNDIEHESLRKRDEMTRQYRDLERKLYDEEARAGAQLQGLGPAGKPRLDELTKQMQKKRADLLTEERQHRQQLDQDTAKKKNETERFTQRHKADIDASVSAKKAAVAK